MSLFGSTTGGQSGGGGLFGGLGQNNQNQQQSGGLFGSSTQANPQQSSGLFGGSTQNTQQNTQQQQPQGGGLFGSLGQKPAQQQGGGLFGGLGQNTPQQQQQQQQPQGGGLFGGLGQSTQQQQPQGGGLFGGLGQSQQQNPPQQTGGLFGSVAGNQPNQQQGGGLFSQSAQTLPPLGQSQLGGSIWQPNASVNPREKSVTDQITTVLQKWDTASPNCAFQYYFYNKVDDNMVPFYRPGPNEDPKAWDEALSKKPGPGFIPVLCVGFFQLGERIKNQQRNLAHYNARLHEINNSLSMMLQNHDTKTSIRAMDARRKHGALKQRCLALAARVQLLRNRGYALGGDEEDLKTKLQALDKAASDPGLGARGEEIWARMLTVQERAKLLKAEIEKSGSDSANGLDEEMTRQAKKIIEDYQTQLNHLKTELETIQKVYVEWESQQPPLQSAKNTKTETDRRAKSAFGTSSRAGTPGYVSYS